MPDGSVMTINRKPFTRRSARKDVWRYHLREMAASEDPLAYIRKYLRVDEELEADPPDPPTSVASAKPSETVKPAAKRPARPLPKEAPAFLKRPYP